MNTQINFTPYEIAFEQGYQAVAQGCTRCNPYDEDAEEEIWMAYEDGYEYAWEKYHG